MNVCNLVDLNLVSYGEGFFQPLYIDKAVDPGAFYLESCFV